MKPRLNILWIALMLPLVLVSVQSHAQDKEQLLQAIIQANKIENGTTVRYNFVQMKHTPLLAQDAKSSGMVEIKGEHSFMWRYIEPKDFAVLMENGKLYMVKDGVREPVATNGNRQFAMAMASMGESMIGGKMLADGRQFEIVIEPAGASVMVTVTPRKRDLKRLMPKAVLTFDAKTYIIQAVQIYEDSQTYTLIRFTPTNTGR